MALDVYVATGSLTSRLLDNPLDSVEDAHGKLNRIAAYPTYRGPYGHSSLYPSYILNEIQSIKTELLSIAAEIRQCRNILSYGPDNYVAIDASRKSEITTWWDRTSYSADQCFAAVQTTIKSTIDYYVDNYKNKGWSYKLVHSALALGKAVPAVAGCVASWVATPFAPTTLLSTAYAAESTIGALCDIHYLWNDDFENVGTTKPLKDALTTGGAELSKMLGGSEATGELIGNAIYTTGDILTTITNARNKIKFKKATHTSEVSDDLGREIQKRLGIGKDGVLDLKSQVIQSDVSFDTFKEAVKEIPIALKNSWSLFTSTPLSQLGKDYKLLTYTIPNIMDVKGTVDLLGKVGKKTATILTDGLNLVQTLVN